MVGSRPHEDPVSENKVREPAIEKSPNMYASGFHRGTQAEDTYTGPWLGF